MATKTKAKKKTAVDPDMTLLQGIQAERYWPQLNQIRDLTREADEQQKSDIESAKATALSSELYANKAMPEIRDIFSRARSETDAANATAGGVIKDTGVAGDVFRNALAREQKASGDRVTNARSGALTDLQNQIVSAKAGEQLGIAQAKKQRGKTGDLLNQRLSDILREQGATSAATLTELQTSRNAAEGKATEAALKEQAKADEKSASAKAKRDKEKAAHVGDVRKATGDFQARIEDAIGTWEQFSSRTAPPYKRDSDGKIETNDKGEPIEDPNGKPVKVSPSEVKDMMAEAGYTPGEIHIALLRRVGKPLDDQAKRYLKGLSGKGVRIPRAWLRNQMEAKIRAGELAGPPVPGS